MPMKRSGTSPTKLCSILPDPIAPPLRLPAHAQAACTGRKPHWEVWRTEALQRKSAAAACTPRGAAASRFRYHVPAVRPLLKPKDENQPNPPATASTATGTSVGFLYASDRSDRFRSGERGFTPPPAPGQHRRSNPRAWHTRRRFPAPRPGPSPRRESRRSS